MFIDPISDRNFEIFSEDDRQFLVQVFFTYPAIGEAFKDFLEISPSARPALAEEITKRTPRTGYVRHDIERPETIYEHLEGLAEFVGNFLARTGASPLRRIHIQEMARVHDLAEAIATDFTLHDDISTEDKHYLEMLAARVIFDSPKYARQLALVEEYMAQVTPESRLLHDFDKIHAVRGALFYASLYPEKSAIYDEFYGNVCKKMKTDEGRAYLQDIHEHKAETIAQLQKLCTKLAVGR